jgi:hypothetical protein
MARQALGASGIGLPECLRDPGPRLPEDCKQLWVCTLRIGRQRVGLATATTDHGLKRTDLPSSGSKNMSLAFPAPWTRRYGGGNLAAAISVRRPGLRTTIAITPTITPRRSRSLPAIITAITLRFITAITTAIIDAAVSIPQQTPPWAHFGHTFVPTYAISVNYTQCYFAGQPAYRSNAAGTDWA